MFKDLNKYFNAIRDKLNITSWKHLDNNESWYIIDNKYNYVVKNGLIIEIIECY